MGYIQKGYVTNLTPAEKTYLLTHPHHIGMIRGHAETALAEARRRFPGAGQHNGRGDAFRHCYWSALLARDIGANNARTFTTAHENYSSNPPGEREMDLHNNAVGIRIGAANASATDGQLANMAISAMNTRQLMLTPGNPGVAYD